MSINYCTVFLVAGLAACQARASEDHREADSTAIHALAGRATAANNAGDVEAWVALFEDNAVYMPPGSQEVTTAAGLREAARAGFGRYTANIRIVPSEITVLGDWAFSRSTVSGTVTPKDGGKAIPIDVKQLTVYHRQLDGGWRIARLMNNSSRE